MPTIKTHRDWLLACILLLAFILTFWPSAVQAQQDGYRLNISRDFGYSNGGGQIRGNFTISVVPLDNIKSVTYLMDGKSIVEVTAAPFKLKFVTTDYPEGWHEMSAQIQTTDGRTVTTPIRRYEFASSEQESAAVKNIVFPLLGGLFLVTIIGMGTQMLFLRNKPKVNLPLGAPRKYGLSGGTICPRCQRPYAIHWWALNAGINSHLDRCDFCGRWGIVRRVSREKLAAAEAAELQMAQPETPIHEPTEEEKLKTMLDESRFTDKS
jgi:hypothetical protein